MYRSPSDRLRILLVGGLLLGAPAVFAQAALAQSTDSTTATQRDDRDRRVRRAPGIEILGDSLAVEDFEGGGAVLRKNRDGFELKVRDGDTDTDHTIQISLGESSRSGGVVRFGEDIIIHEDEFVDGDVVAMGGDILVKGRVNGDVVAMGGDVTLVEGAQVTSDVVGLGGTLTLSDGVYVGGDAVSVWGTMEKSVLAEVAGDVVEVGGFAPMAWSGNPLDRDGIFSGVSALVRRAIWVGLLIGLGILIFNVFPSRMERLADTVAADGPKAFLAGLAGWVLWLPVFVALLITIIGALAAVALIFLTPLMVLFGYVAAAAVFGSRWGGRMGGAVGDRTRSIAIGILVLESGVLLGRLFGVLGSFFDVIGLILSMVGYTVIFIAGTTGFGAILMTRFRAKTPGGDSGEIPVPGTPTPGQPLPSVGGGSTGSNS